MLILFNYLLLKVKPFKMTTSSSFLIGRDLTLCSVLSSFDKVTLINFYLKWDGAVKWAYFKKSNKYI